MNDEMKVGFGIAGAFALLVLIIFGWMFGGPHYSVWQQGMAGKAKLMRAEQEKQIQIEQAKAEVESAKLRAEAIETVGKAAQKFPEYRHQEYIGAFATALEEGLIEQIIYIPTEAGVPIIEAGRSTN